MILVIDEGYEKSQNLKLDSIPKLIVLAYRLKYSKLDVCGEYLSSKFLAKASINTS